MIFMLALNLLLNNALATFLAKVPPQQSVVPVQTQPLVCCVQSSGQQCCSQSTQSSGEVTGCGCKN
jgi:hypothetical protein